MTDFLSSLKITHRDLIEAVVGGMFFADWGFVKSVSSDKTMVDVEHAVRPTVAGQQLGSTTTLGVRVVYPSSARLSVRYELKAGDPVLLVGLKDYVKDLDGTPDVTDVGLQYAQETMVAVPFGPFLSGSDFTVEVDSNKKLTVTCGSDSVVWDGSVRKIDISVNGNVIEATAGKVTINGNLEVDQ